MSRRPALLAALLAGCVVLAGCAAIPTTGPVRAGPPAERDADGGLRFQPVSPARGAPPAAVVRGFLLAASGVEDDHAFARAYLAPRPGEAWRPGAGTTVVADGSAELTLTQGGAALADDARPDPAAGPVTATMAFTVLATVDGNGRLQPAAPGTRQEVTYTLGVVDGEWRITGLPDGLLLDRAGFDLAFKPYQLYWVDPARSYLVPETRWFGVRRAVVTTLVTELLRGPSPWLAPAVTTGFPTATTLTRPPAVPVVDGEAQVDLTRTALRASSEERALMQAQLQATLQPVASVSTVRMTVEDGELVLPDTVPPLVRDPGVDAAAVAVAGGTLVHVAEAGVAPVEDLPDLSGLDVGDPARGATSYALLAGAGTRLLHVVPGTPAGPEPLLTGDALTAPSVDPLGWIWSTPAASGPRVMAVRPGAGVAEVDAPWLDGRRITALRVARDGARLLVASSGADGADRVDLAGVQRDGEGRPVALTRSSATSLVPALTSVADLAWTGEASAALLGRRPDDARNRVFLVEPLGTLPVAAADVPDDASLVALTAGTGERSVTVATDAGTLWQRAGAQWVQVPAEVPVSDPEFAG